VVRAVFKQNNSDTTDTGCPDFQLAPRFDKGSATAVVRCELALPSGAGSENERALRSKEVNCRICDSCENGEGRRLCREWKQREGRGEQQQQGRL